MQTAGYLAEKPRTTAAVSSVDPSLTTITSASHDLASMKARICSRVRGILLASLYAGMMMLHLWLFTTALDAIIQRAVAVRNGLWAGVSVNWHLVSGFENSLCRGELGHFCLVFASSCRLTHPHTKRRGVLHRRFQAASLFSLQECQKDGHKAGAKRNYTPHNPLPGWRSQRGGNRGCGRNPDSCPHRDVAVVVAFDLAPSSKSKQRLIVSIVNKNVSKAVVRSVAEHLGEGQHSFRVVKLCTAQLSYSMQGHLWKAAG